MYDVMNVTSNADCAVLVPVRLPTKGHVHLSTFRCINMTWVLGPPGYTVGSQPAVIAIPRLREGDTFYNVLVSLDWTELQLEFQKSDFPIYGMIVAHQYSSPIHVILAMASSNSRIDHYKKLSIYSYCNYSI